MLAYRLGMTIYGRPSRERGKLSPSCVMLHFLLHKVGKTRLSTMRVARADLAPVSAAAYTVLAEAGPRLKNRSWLGRCWGL